MLDIGFSKLFIIGGIALVVIGPERLPKVARMVGTMLGRAQRYVADVKSEVSRSIELEELNKARQAFESAAHDVQRGAQELHQDVDQALSSMGQSLSAEDEAQWNLDPHVTPVYVRTKKNWRVKRGAIPTWYKHKAGVRTHVQSGAARVARFRPHRSA
ncbi:MAG: Sec-independent protein translocase protein TatB [Leptothrix ochracea]|uniref:Sec-independent protein translocase protein TatB n=1 Tax=Leptothrix ochracea TaxID=735331 RepID=UPI0034E207F9